MRKSILVLALLLVPGLAFAESGVQWTRDRDATLISKDVGAERWAITYRLSDGRLTGNVFRSDGGPSSFLDCPRTSTDGTSATFTCYGASACGGAPCPTSQYTLIASGVSLPLTFLFPPGDVPVAGKSVDDMLGSWRFVITTSQDTIEFTYRFDDVERFPEGDIAIGESVPGGNPVYATRPGFDGSFVVFDESEFGCNTYVFDFVSDNRIEGSEFATRFNSSTGLCTGERINNVTNSFVAERIGSSLQREKID